MSTINRRLPIAADRTVASGPGQDRNRMRSPGPPPPKSAERTTHIVRMQCRVAWAGRPGRCDTPAPATRAQSALYAPVCMTIPGNRLRQMRWNPCRPGDQITDITLKAGIIGIIGLGDQIMSTMGVSGPSSGLFQFLTSLGTSGTTPSRPIDAAGSAGVSALGSLPAKDVDAGLPNGKAVSAPSQSRPQQLASLIQTTLNTLSSDHTGNPLDALQSIAKSPGVDGLLGELNIDPQQFRSDILSAMTRSPNGIPNLSLVFQNFPTGQSLNTLA